MIAGGGGFLGRELERYFLSCGDEVIILSRKSTGKNDRLWDGETLGEWVIELEGADVLINLSGRSVDCRYNLKNKQEIFDSRQMSTAILGQALSELEKPPEVWLNASTATIYAHSNGKQHDEETGDIGEGFSVDVAKLWEETFFAAKSPSSVRKVCMRMAIILAEKGPFMQVMKRLVKLRLGGRQGTGEQEFSWLHIDDFIAAIEWLVEAKEQSGVFNLSAPVPLKNKEVMSNLRRVCGVTCGLPAPTPLVHIGAFVMRTEAELPFKSRCVIPGRLQKENFEFKYKIFADAVESLVS